MFRLIGIAFVSYTLFNYTFAFMFGVEFTELVKNAL